MKLNTEIIKLLQSKSGLDLKSSRDCEKLSSLIMEQTQHRISPSTLKRLLGFYSDQHMPYPFTLEVLAGYLGYGSWDVLKETLGKESSDFIELPIEVTSSRLDEGEVVRITYQPDRELLFRHCQQNTFVVDASVNSKLGVGDEVEIQRFVLGYPLFVASVKRGGENLGSYVAARQLGITTIEVVEP